MGGGRHRLSACRPGPRSSARPGAARCAAPACSLDAPHLHSCVPLSAGLTRPRDHGGKPSAALRASSVAATEMPRARRSSCPVGTRAEMAPHLAGRSTVMVHANGGGRRSQAMEGHAALIGSTEPSGGVVHAQPARPRPRPRPRIHRTHCGGLYLLRRDGGGRACCVSIVATGCARGRCPALPGLDGYEVVRQARALLGEHITSVA
jgi:hypothetical protein